MEKKLNEFSVGERGVVMGIEGEGQIRRRLLDMGVSPGAEIRLRKLAPLGDPVEVTLRGYELTLRKAEASSVVMRSEGAEESVALQEDPKKAARGAKAAAQQAKKEAKEAKKAAKQAEKAAQKAAAQAKKEGKA